jgi:hypothetical protein
MEQATKLVVQKTMGGYAVLMREDNQAVCYVYPHGETGGIRGMTAARQRADEIAHKLDNYDGIERALVGLLSALAGDEPIDILDHDLTGHDEEGCTLCEARAAIRRATGGHE